MYSIVVMKTIPNLFRYYLIIIFLIVFKPVVSQVIKTIETGVASYYSKNFYGKKTANGERF